MRFLEPYAALADEELVTLASTGMLRRARKLSGDVVEQGSDAKGADLVIGGCAVRVDGRGPAAVACQCPTGGVCVHMVVAWRWARDRAAERGVRPPTVPGADDQDPASGSERGSSPGRPGGDGTAAAGASSAGAVGTGSAEPVPPSRADETQPAKRAAVRRPVPRGHSAAARRRAVALAEVRDAVVHLLDSGLAHVRDDAPEAFRALAGRVRVAGFDPVHGLRLDALLRTASGQAADLAAHADGTDESDLLSTLTEIWALCEVHARAGRADEEAAPTPHGTGRAGEAGRAGADDGTGATGVTGVTGRARGAGTTGRAREDSATRAEGVRRPAGRRSSREEDEVDVARLVPLGVRWWTAPSGSRGLVLAAWDPAEECVRTAVTGRPAGSDPTFRREWDAPLLWKASPARLSEGPFSLTAVRTRPDGTLGAGGTPRVESLGDLDLEELREIADRTGTARPPRDTVGFGRRPSHVRLLLVRDTGEIGIDEVRQDLTWAVTDSVGKEHLLRVPVEDRRTADTLLHVLAGRRPVVGVTVERREGRVEPVGLFLRGDGGSIRLVSPSVTEEYQIGRESRWSHHLWDTWRRRMSRVARMRSRAQAVTEGAEPDPPAVRACRLAWDVLVAVAATGRRRLTARQRSDLDLARALGRDLGLSTLERAVSDLTRDDADLARDDAAREDAGRDIGAVTLTPAAVARAAFLVRRTREVAAAAQVY
ncbi:hypothetical protein [Myceligenerans indicum]|uniref:SWIM-type domain-containing protein n=1 Tax=Myceligenerans indicum TaxID=2593663 RepID=A0ABS1LQR2_9MICO|nr:hypothetical protein [Myceligenerans indicum]MBL0888575.1 hypothetical protein [Myceligenerans indicum]